jgi:hypothetical protein
MIGTYLTIVVRYMGQYYNEKSVSYPNIIHPVWCLGGSWFTLGPQKKLPY